MFEQTLPFNLLVLFIVSTVSAVLQDFWTPIGIGCVKPPFLLATAVYYAWMRPPAFAVPAVFWCGILSDGLGALPLGTSVVAFLAMLGLFRRIGKKQLAETVSLCTLLGICAVPAVAAVECMSLYLAGRLPSVPWRFLGSRVMWSGLLAFPVCVAVAWLAGRLDKMAYNLQTENHVGNYDEFGNRL